MVGARVRVGVYGERPGTPSPCLSVVIFGPPVNVFSTSGCGEGQVARHIVGPGTDVVSVDPAL